MVYPATLRCSKCNEQKPFDAFRKRPGRAEAGKRCGRWSSCTDCEKAYASLPHRRVKANARSKEFRTRLLETNPKEAKRREREQNLRRKYGFGESEYDAMAKSQNGLCAICGQPPTTGRGKKLHVDHDHTTGEVRGLLCGACNVSLGGFSDDTATLKSAIRYLRRAHSAKRTQL